MAEEIVEQGYRELAATIHEHNPGVDLGRVRAAFEVADLAKTSVCPLARVMRRELGRRGVKHLKVVYSKEQPLTPLEDDEISCKYHCVCPPDSKRDCSIRRQVPGSVSFVPSVMGLIIAGEFVRDLVCIGR